MWQPKLDPSDPAQLYRRLLQAIEAGIAAGELQVGDRLPPQRDLAHRLAISVGAVTHAYDEAARLGLVAAHVGRGTFIAGAGRGDAVADGLIDLSVNVAPFVPTELLAETAATFRRTASWANRLTYQPPHGLDGDRQAGAAWLAATACFADLDWRRLICCAGAQGGMAIALAALCKPGDVLLCEAATFPGVKTLAAQQGCRLHGIEMDDEGLMPQALDRAAAKTGARALYVLPTLQNPTARTMGKARREDIVRIARRRDLWIIEDDVYALYARHLDLPPLASLAPERTIYVSSLSKTLAPGLRAGFLVAPAGDVLDRCSRAARALMHSPNGITTAIATHWIESGRAQDLARNVLDEIRARVTIAGNVLKDFIAQPQPAVSLHLWLPMPQIQAERTIARASMKGLRLAAPMAFAASENAESGLRLCVGGVPNRATLERALSLLSSSLSGHDDYLDAI
ncbi:aminotransferase-like domain-containing protein [Methylovirgula sp. 4M-Z18]|uniref:aminotransferase-like domain-containing protein n=1 Tax=Methylovirgula sp. 4M-Z18 TaxID=2293567 RepID=UPI000E2FDA30|nr:PLP-dependent aminotransferase family protein [Methylovirgula sp. 4M-Z18]RFB81421.1 PLP-dependent aminotransferase family protein [Methylovirgula sp. 4M-Z18]